MSLMQAKRVGQMAAGGLLLLLLLAPASAQQPTQAQRDAIKQSCRSDFMSHCSGVQPGGKEALDCLKSNGPQLSPNCRAAVDAIQPGQKPAEKPAGKPSQKASAPAAGPPPPRPGEMPMAAPPPPAMVPMIAPADLALLMRACGIDVGRYCPGVQPGGGREIACLAANGRGLTFRCRRALRLIAPALR